MNTKFQTVKFISTFFLIFVFTTFLPQNLIKAQEVIFTAGGDLGAVNNSASLKSFKEIAKQQSQFFLAIGDMNYKDVGDEKGWCNALVGDSSRPPESQSPILGHNFPFQIVVGNHEDENRFDGYIKTFTQYCPDRLSSVGNYGVEYYFDYPKINPLVRVIMIGANHNFDLNGGGVSTWEQFNYNSQNIENKKHLDWLGGAIDSGRNAKIPWVVVGMHKNCITLGVKGCEIGAELLTFLVEKKVDLILQGHDHTYQRSKQLSLGPNCSTISSGTANSACILNANEYTNYEKGMGPLLVITGHFGGGGFYNVSSSDKEVSYFAKAMGGNGWYDFSKNNTLNKNPSRGITKITLSENFLKMDEINTSSTSSGFSDSFNIIDCLNDHIDAFCIDKGLKYFDYNYDTKFNISDVVLFIKHLLDSAVPITNQTAKIDVNMDGKIDFSDVVKLILLLR